jgi:thymidylate kinase
MHKAHPLRIAIVGPCSAGKSTLVKALREAGYDARHVAQEHSYVPAMWQRIGKPDLLIYLDLSYATARARRPYIDGGPQRLAEQHRRLAHARKHCSLYVNTNMLTPQQVQEQVLQFLRRYQLPLAAKPASQQIRAKLAFKR